MSEEQNIETNKTSDQSGITVDRTTLDLMIGALKQHESATELEDEVLEDICIEAFSLGKMNDFQWLSDKLQQVTGEEVELSVSTVNNEEIEEITDIKELTGSEHLEKIQVSKPVRVEDPEHMKEVLIQHEIWMNSVLHPREEISGGRANLKEANLQGYDLVGVNLSCADFRNANLMGANLQGANLSNTWLQGANLQGANLTGAKLKRAKLERTDLREAELTDVDMESTDFSKSIFKDSDLTRREKELAESNNIMAEENRTSKNIDDSINSSTPSIDELEVSIDEPKAFVTEEADLEVSNETPPTIEVIPDSVIEGEISPLVSPERDS